MAYFLTAAAASGIFIVAGWRGRNARVLGSGQTRGFTPSDPLWAEDEIELDRADSRADATAAIRLALRRLAPVIARQLIKVEIAAPPGLLVRMRGAALADLVEELLAAAINEAPAGRLLVAAAMRGDHIHISVTDDTPGADQAARIGSVRGLSESVAMRGGALDVNVLPDAGTTMTLRLAQAVEDRPDSDAETWSEPAEVPAAPLVASLGR